MIWTIRDTNTTGQVDETDKTKHVQTEITEQLLETVQFISQDVLYATHYCLMSILR